MKCARFDCPNESLPRQKYCRKECAPYANYGFVNGDKNKEPRPRKLKKRNIKQLIKEKNFI